MEIEKPLGDWDFPSITKYFEALIEAQRQILDQCSEIIQKRQSWTFGLGHVITHWRQLTNTRPSELAKILNISTEYLLEAEQGRARAILAVLRLMIEKRLIAGSVNNMVIPSQYYGPQGEDGANK